MARTTLIKQAKAAAASSDSQSQSQPQSPSAQDDTPETTQPFVRPTTYLYPGLGLPVRANDEGDYGFYPIGAHGSNDGSSSELLFLRELAMLNVMEKLSDKEDWQKKVFDDEIVAKWRKEALAIPDEQFMQLAIGAKRQWWNDNTGELQLQDDGNGRMETLEGIMSETAFDCCVQELRSKAKYFEKSGIIPTLDASASVAKSDKLVSPELHEALKSAFEKLKADHAAAPDWHPNSNDMVQDLIHPSMYPLVYGRSRVFKDEVVGVDDAVEKWAGKGDIIPKEVRVVDSNDRFRYGVGSGEVPPNYWSDTYQWLPANFGFQEDGSVKFTSYINNLHPNKYPDIYRTIEKLIETSLPMWDQCLSLVTDCNISQGAGRRCPRYPRPSHADDDNEENWTLNIPEGSDEVEFDAEGFTREHGYDPNDPSSIEQNGMEEEDVAEDIKDFKWKTTRKPVMPEPSFSDVDYTPKNGKRLIDRYRESGLQVIVKMASIELTPEKPDFPIGGWHVEGQMNEHICATALYYLDSENVTDTNLSFRMQTSAYLQDDSEYSVGQDSYHWLEKVYGTSLGQGNSPCLQNYGSVDTREGRLLAFPNVFQHRVSPFRLTDPTLPGHRRFIALWLVDPTKRILSTANVPPQQLSWWLDSVLGGPPTTPSHHLALSKLPPEILTLLHDSGLPVPGGSANPDAADANATLPVELMEMVRAWFEQGGKEGLPMSADEAARHRKELMRERSAFHVVAEEGWQQHSYSFCEH